MWVWVIQSISGVGVSVGRGHREEGRVLVLLAQQVVVISQLQAGSLRCKRVRGNSLHERKAWVELLWAHTNLLQVLVACDESSMVVTFKWLPSMFVWVNALYSAVTCSMILL